MDVVSYNSRAWDSEVKNGNQWTLAVSTEKVNAARTGDFEIILTPMKPVPTDWYPALVDCRILCLAGGGGQQGPLLAAAGAKVTVFDASPKQLEQDRIVADRDALDLVTVQGDMRDLSVFGDRSFDFIVHPVSNCFVQELQPVWNEAFRVLSSGGTLIAGMGNPATYIFDWEAYEKGSFVVRHSLPYSSIKSLTKEELQRSIDESEPLEFSHSLDAQIGGQLRAGFQLIDFFEDYWGEKGEQLMDSIMPSFFATRARKP